MSLDFNSLLAPITEDAPGGSDCRDSETYEQMAAEVDKLTSLTSESVPNWNRIEQLATEFLRTQSKDYLVAAWLAESWVERNTMQGVAAGLCLLSGLVDQYWETGFPTLKRLRGRRNAILWWTERVASWLEDQTDVSISAELSEQMMSAAKALDQGLSEKDPEAPTLSSLIGHIHRLPIEEPPKAQEAPPSETKPALVSAQEQGNQSVPSSDAPVVQATGAVAPTAAVASPAPKLGSSDKLMEIGSLEDLGTAIKPAQDYLAQLGPLLYAFDNTNPLVIHFSRFSARSGIFKLPNAKEGKTLIGSPPVAIRDAFEKVSNSKSAQGIVDFCESRIRTFPFWFDLDYQSFHGFSMMGSAGNRMAHTIIENLLGFLDRLPTIEQMSFSDGIPFASLDTIAWIKRSREERSGGAPTDAFSVVKNSATLAMTEGQSDQALQELQRFIDNTRSKRDQFRARLLLAEMLIAQRPEADLRPLVRPLIDDCERLGLDQWEPALAAQAWELQVRVTRLVAANKSAGISESQRTAAKLELETALKHLSISDFTQAARLT